MASSRKVRIVVGVALWVGMPGLWGGEELGGGQIPGDCNQDARLDISDGICLLNFLFLGTVATLPCADGSATHASNLALLDSNGDSGLDLSDAVRVLGFLFVREPPPVLGTDCIPIAGCKDICTRCEVFTSHCPAERPPDLQEDLLLRGDVNGDGAVDVADAVALAQWLCLQGPDLTCLDAADTNDDGCVNAIDFQHFPFPGLCPFPELEFCLPRPPYPSCGWDPTPDFLGCRGSTRFCTVPACGLAPMREETLARLSLWHSGVLETRVLWPGEVSMKPGQSAVFKTGIWQCCYFFEELPACVEWSVFPDVGTVIDLSMGRLTVDPAATHGAVFTLAADVENGRRVLSIPIRVYTQERNPLVGIWRERAQINCASDQEVEPAGAAIEEFFLNAAGSFAVTWTPFEVYRDYWGSYTYDLTSGTIAFHVEGGNYIPPDLDGTGEFRISQAGDLLLEDLWFGTPPPFLESGPAELCGHRFERH